jgi:spore coat polysaccharide biosynthesis protein SpsF
MVVLVVQARMGSTRLPGKVLAAIAERPMLSFQLERLRHCREIDRIVIATTTQPADDAIARFCAAERVACVRGSEHDVLSRYADAARCNDASVVVRVTADCPLIEPTLVDEAVATFRVGGFDYVSNMLEPSWPYGMAVEVFSRRALDEAHAEASDPAEREHVTPFIYWRPERYRLKSMRRPTDLSAHRWTVDTPEDLELVSRILVALYPRRPEFTLQDVLDILRQHPEWEQINRHVPQKSVAPRRETP